jgi:hypothetical protein
MHDAILVHVQKAIANLSHVLFGFWLSHFVVWIGYLFEQLTARQAMNAHTHVEQYETYDSNKN